MKKINILKKLKKDKKIKVVKDFSYDASHGYSVFMSSETLNRSNDYIVDLAKDYDSRGYMSLELGKELDDLYKADDYIIGIHRTGYTDITNNTLNDIFNKGLINNGHIMSGGNSGTTDIEKTVTLIYDITVLSGQLKAASGYKNSQGCILVKIPKSYLGKKEGEVKPIYYNDGSLMRLLPEYIYGYIPVSDNRVGDIVHNKNYKDIHNYNNEGLVYDDSAYYKLKRQGIDLYKESNLSLSEKYNILEKAYKDTFNKYGRYQAEQALLRFINNYDVKCFTNKNNRECLKKYISRDEIMKVLLYGACDIKNNDINAIIKAFQNNITNSNDNKNTLK